MITGMAGRFYQLALQMFITFVELLRVIKSIQHSQYLDYLANNSLFVVLTKKKMAVCAALAYLDHFSRRKLGKKNHTNRRGGLVSFGAA